MTFDRRGQVVGVLVLTLCHNGHGQNPMLSTDQGNRRMVLLHGADFPLLLPVIAENPYSFPHMCGNLLLQGALLPQSRQENPLPYRVPLPAQEPLHVQVSVYELLIFCSVQPSDVRIMLPTCILCPEQDTKAVPQVLKDIMY